MISPVFVTKLICKAVYPEGCDFVVVSSAFNSLRFGSFASASFMKETSMSRDSPYDFSNESCLSDNIGIPSFDV